MAATLRKTRQDEVRAKIGASVLISNLEKHAKGEREMTATQIKATEILLRKVIPDVSAVELTGQDGGPVQVDTTLSPTDAYLKLLGKV